MVTFLILLGGPSEHILLATPVYRHLKKQVEDARILFLSSQEHAPLLEANPNIDMVIPCEGKLRSCLRQLKNENIDYIIDLQNNTFSFRLKLRMRRLDFTVRKYRKNQWLRMNSGNLPGLHRADLYMECIRHFIGKQDELGLDYFIPANQEVDIGSLPAPLRKGYVVLAIGAAMPTKKLPADLLIELCSKLDSVVLLVGRPEDAETGKTISGSLKDRHVFNGAGKYSLHQSASLIRQAKGVIAHDSDFMQIAAALNKKIIVIWGSSLPELGGGPYKTDPSSANLSVPGLSCQPCSESGYWKCPEKHFYCMRKQDLDHIAALAREMFKASYSGHPTGK